MLGVIKVLSNRYSNIHGLRFSSRYIDFFSFKFSWDNNHFQIRSFFNTFGNHQTTGMSLNNVTSDVFHVQHIIRITLRTLISLGNIMYLYHTTIMFTLLCTLLVVTGKKYTPFTNQNVTPAAAQMHTVH